MRFVYIALFALSLCSCQTTTTKKTSSGIGNMYLAKNTLFAFKPAAPVGWELGGAPTNTNQSVHATLYPKGGSFEDSEAVMYIQSQPITAEIKTFEEVAKYVIKGFRAQGHNNFSGSKVRTITAQTGIKVPIWQFSGDNFGNREASGYMMGRDEILSVVLSARNKEAYDNATPAFYSLIKSYGGFISPTKLAN